MHVVYHPAQNLRSHSHVLINITWTVRAGYSPLAEVTNNNNNNKVGDLALF